jgi:hypothetical protein
MEEVVVKHDPQKSGHRVFMEIVLDLQPFCGRFLLTIGHAEPASFPLLKFERCAERLSETCLR